ncbi:2-amino-4-hydroxy-6-hydroxymethyldihydropteridine diphosphokinase [Candidatus Peregrinibacteria bacterium CG_4_10_14_0_2_um_filter_43_11]|nr:MAG: 2-amino-4-hydroxy-6-hydroxymethyldihydropteridine diphosphokinase [Candidatus Peregrinibacteria bacterium CG_4_10_14_0_2_um_filter_43_11]
MKVVYLSFGSNKGDRGQYLKKAIRFLAENSDITVVAQSRIHETEAWPEDSNQPDFLNQVIKIKTSLQPLELLFICQQIEKKVGRTPSRHWGPREIDIDILLYGDEVMDLPNLQIPHHYIHEREFVLIPLIEIEPELKDPIHGKLYSDFLTALKNGS